ncbi:MAG: hypothetical protein M3176_13460 [Chloroflexota bacterium]|nr:hypothetical protein [Chloroflexota bacterium]MDQ6907826.1 hypothetical protein [Chloroflexota bacterium]
MARHHRITIQPEPGFTAALQRLDAFAMYPPDWDDGGAATIASDTILRAKELVQGVYRSVQHSDEAEPFYIGPIPNGGIQVEWRGIAEGIEVEIRPDGTYGCLHVQTNAHEPAMHHQRAVSYDTIVALVAGILDVSRP